MSELVERSLSEPQRLHPAGVVLIGIRIARELVVPALLPLVVQLIRTEFDVADPLMLFLVGLALLILVGGGAGYGFLAWTRYTYRVEGGELRIEQGVIIRKRRYIPLERIQAVDLVEGVLQRLLGVVSVRVKTAGGGGGEPEASLIAVSRDGAIHLQQELAHRGAAVPTRGVEAAPAAERRPLRRLTFGDLLLVGSISGRVGVALSVVASAYAFLANTLPFDLWPDLETWALGMASLALLGLALVGAAWLLGLIGTILAHLNFTITKNDDSLLIERGLLERRRATIPVARIQAIRVVENWLPQLFGYAELRVESAGYGRDAGESTVLYPLLRRDEVLAFLREAAPEFAVEPTLQPLPRRARPRYLGRAIILSGLIVGTLAALFYPFGFWALIFIPLAALLGLWQYRDAGWGIAGDVLALRTRSLGRTTAIIPRRRIQSSEITSNPFQRRVGLATFSVRVASGSAGKSFSLLHLDADDAMFLFSWSGPRAARAERALAPPPAERAHPAIMPITPRWESDGG